MAGSARGLLHCRKPFSSGGYQGRFWRGSACCACPARRPLLPRVVPSSPGAGGPRHVGRVVDPSVRDDGDPEPDLQLASEVAALDEAAPDESTRAPRNEGGERARERLLARAHAARPDASNEGPVRGGLEEIGRSEAREARDGELEAALGSAGRTSSASLSARSENQLSPTLI